MLTKIKLTGNVMIGGKPRKPGDVVEVRHFLAQDLIYRNKAEVYIPGVKSASEKALRDVEEAIGEPPELTEEEKEEIAEEAEEVENPEEEEEKDLADYSREELEEMARDLGINFPNNIKDATLQKKIEKVLEEQGE